MKKILTIFFSSNAKFIADIKKLLTYEVTIRNQNCPVLFADSQQEVLEAIESKNNDTQIILVTGTTLERGVNLETPDFITLAKKLDDSIITVLHTFENIQSHKVTELVDGVIERFANLEEKTNTCNALREKKGVYTEVAIDSLMDYDIINFLFEVSAATDRKEIMRTISNYVTAEVV